MGRPSKFGEPTEAIRVPISKLPEVQSVIEGRFVQNSDFEQQVESLVEHTLNRCEEEGVSSRRLLLLLLFEDLCQTLDRFSKQERMEFVARLVDRYIGE